MGHKHQHILDAIFTNPLSGNIHWRDIESLLRHLGGVIEPAHGARLRITLNGVQGTLHRPHHSGVCEKHDIRHLREFLVQAGVGPASDDAGD